MIKINGFAFWEHHRSGWKVCMEALNKYHSPDGVLFIDYLEDVTRNGRIIPEPWVGITHNVFRHPVPFINQLHGPVVDIDLERMVDLEIWKANLPLCRGLFCLCEYNAEFLRSRVNVPVFSVTHPTGKPYCYFSFDMFAANPTKMIFLIGHWMRNFQAFYDLQTPWKKVMFCVPTACNYPKLDSLIKPSPTVQRMQRQSDQDYDLLLSHNLVFLNLFDCAACNTVVECIVRHTPVLVNRLPALEEYLGPAYPFFYSDLSEASAMSADLSLVKRAHEYLVALPKERFAPEYFARTVIEHIRSASCNSA